MPKKMAATAITSSTGEADNPYDENEGDEGDEEELATDVGDDAMIKVKDKSLTGKKGQGGKVNKSVNRNDSHAKKKTTAKSSNKKKHK